MLLAIWRSHKKQGRGFSFAYGRFVTALRLPSKKFFHSGGPCTTSILLVLLFSPTAPRRMLRPIGANPIRALYWSAVISGVVAVPVMIIMMYMTANPEVL
jgi:hypothetical protein